jgi:uncharacterized protein YjaG (DUF416 family)
MTDQEKYDALFAGLVMMFHAAAMQQMGKVKNPSSDTLERNLEQAQMSIDMLDMLERMTKGNLNDEQSRFLKNVQQELKLNYVDEVSKEQKGTPPS